MPDGDTRFKCCPPVREAGNRDALWQGLADGTIDMVVSDHSPCTPELKRWTATSARPGAASRRCSWRCRWCGPRRAGAATGSPTSSGGWPSGPPHWPASPRKGRIAAGQDADLTIFAPDATFTVGELQHRHPITPYAGRELTGVVPRHLAARGTDRRRRAGDSWRGPMMDFGRLPDLARRDLGGAVVWANDEAFAARQNLITPGPPVFDPTAFGPDGKVYDGWETRRRREPGHDTAEIRLGAPGIVRGDRRRHGVLRGQLPARSGRRGVAGRPGRWIRAGPAQRHQGRHRERVRRDVRRGP